MRPAIDEFSLRRRDRPEKEERRRARRAKHRERTISGPDQNWKRA